MKGIISKNHIDYIFYHLSFYVKDFNNLNPYFRFESNEKKIIPDKKAICFLLSTDKLKENSIICIDDIPILFPVLKTKEFYTINTNLIFNHDLLKSAFYLLSGYQEFESKKQDNLGRFPYSESIQSKLNNIHKPIVNYYFDIILKGMEEFCTIHNIPFIRRTVFNEPKVMLTHDVDRINTYTINEFIFIVKQFFGLAKKTYSGIYHFFLLCKYFIGLMTKKWNNPVWNFDTIRAMEEEFTYKSVFFFLKKDLLHHDSYYQFHNKRIKRLFTKLHEEECEIGLHGTVSSSSEMEAMKQNYEELFKESPQKPVGIRQHRLLFNHPDTMLYQEKAGLKYDSTLGFAAHEGFRNSYCLPFKLYDFKNNCIIDVWEIPLIAMDGTLFSYRKLDPEQVFQIIQLLIHEIKKFNGIFTILWHNGFGIDHPDRRIKKFYKRILESCHQNKLRAILGKNIVKRMSEMDNK